MKFRLIPILDLIIDFYRKRKNFARFQNYLSLLLNEEKTDVGLPIMLYNPMGKEHILRKLEELKATDAEALAERSIGAVNSKLSGDKSFDKDLTFQVALNLADDAQGGWTNRYSTDYQGKFKSEALIKRRFCTPIFWTSQTYGAAAISRETEGYLWRTVYQLKSTRFKTLQDHLLQEAYVSCQLDRHTDPTDLEDEKIGQIYQHNRKTTDYPFIFAFLYGDAAAREFGYSKNRRVRLYGL